MPRQKTYPQIYVFKEKHGDIFYLIESEEAENKMFLEVLSDRKKCGWYDWMKDYIPYEKKPTYIKEDIESMPDSMLEEKKRLLNEYKKYERSEMEAKNIRNKWVKIQESVETKNGELAGRILNSLNGGEYEGFESVSFEHIK